LQKTLLLFHQHLHSPLSCILAFEELPLELRSLLLHVLQGCQALARHLESL
jgi:hypothetical protein